MDNVIDRTHVYPWRETITCHRSIGFLVKGLHADLEDIALLCHFLHVVAWNIQNQLQRWNSGNINWSQSEDVNETEAKMWENHTRGGRRGKRERSWAILKTFCKVKNFLCNLFNIILLIAILWFGPEDDPFNLYFSKFQHCPAAYSRSCGMWI